MRTSPFNAFLRDHLKANNKCSNLTITNLDSLYSQLTHKPLPYGNEHASEKENALTEFLMDWSSYSLPYKHIIIDEGQDFASDHLRLLHDIAEEQSGCFYIFYDKHQFVQGRAFPEWLNGCIPILRSRITVGEMVPQCVFPLVLGQLNL